MVLNRPSKPVNEVMSSWTNSALVRSRSWAACVAAATAVGVSSMPTTV